MIFLIFIYINKYVHTFTHSPVNSARYHEKFASVLSFFLKKEDKRVVGAHHIQIVFSFLHYRSSHYLQLTGNTDVLFPLLAKLHLSSFRYFNLWDLA